MPLLALFIHNAVRHGDQAPAPTAKPPGPITAPASWPSKHLIPHLQALPGTLEQDLKLPLKVRSENGKTQQSGFNPSTCFASLTHSSFSTRKKSESVLALVPRFLDSVHRISMQTPPHPLLIHSHESAALDSVRGTRVSIESLWLFTASSNRPNPSAPVGNP